MSVRTSVRMPVTEDARELTGSDRIFRILTVPLTETDGIRGAERNAVRNAEKNGARSVGKSAGKSVAAPVDVRRNRTLAALLEGGERTKIRSLFCYASQPIYNAVRNVQQVQ